MVEYCKVDPSLFSELKERVSRETFSESQWVKLITLKMIQRVISGKLRGIVYTDKWPDFAVVLCHITTTVQLANGMILCCTTCQEDTTVAMVDELSRVHDGVGWIVGTYNISLDHPNGLTSCRKHSTHSCRTTLRIS